MKRLFIEPSEDLWVSSQRDSDLNTVERKHEGLEREHSVLTREHRVLHGGISLECVSRGANGIGRVPPPLSIKMFRYLLHQPLPSVSHQSDQPTPQ